MTSPLFSCSIYLHIWHLNLVYQMHGCPDHYLKILKSWAFNEARPSMLRLHSIHLGWSLIPPPLYICLHIQQEIRSKSGLGISNFQLIATGKMYIKWGGHDKYESRLPVAYIMISKHFSAMLRIMSLGSCSIGAKLIIRVNFCALSGVSQASLRCSHFMENIGSSSQDSM